MSAISVLLIVTIWQHHVQTFDVIPVPFQHPTSVSHKTKAEVVTSTKTFGVKHSHMVAVLLAQKEAQCLEIYGGKTDISAEIHNSKALIQRFGCYKNETYTDCNDCTAFTGINSLNSTCRDLFPGNATFLEACVNFRNSIDHQIQRLERSKCRREGRLSNRHNVWQPGRLLETPHVFCETVDNASDASGLNYVHYVVLKWTLIKKNAADGSLLELKTPLVFVVDQKRKNETDWRTILKTTHGLQPVTVTSYPSTYQWRITAVSERGIEDCATTEEYTTINKVQNYDLPTSVYIITSITKPNRAVDVLIGWKPSQDIPCNYRLTLNSTSNKDATRIVYIDEPIGVNQWWFDNLELNTTYILWVAPGALDVYESKPAKLLFTTASCLEAYDFDFNLCPPSAPRNLTATISDPLVIKGNKVSVRLAWLSPANSNGSNRVSQYEIEFFPFSPTMKTKVTPWRITQPGNTTSFLVHDGLEVDTEFSIVLRAISHGGRSNGIHIYFNTKSGRKVDNVNHQPGSGSAMGILFLMLLLAGFLVNKCYCCCTSRRQLVRKESLSDSLTTGTLVEGSPCFNLFDNDFPSDLWEIPASCVTISRLLGSGTFGTVYMGKVSKALILEKFRRRNQVKSWLTLGTEDNYVCPEEKEQVAVKTIPLPVNADYNSFSSICQEYKIMQNLDFHPNIVSLFGAYLEEKHLCLVLEYCPGGCLLEYLHKFRDGREVEKMTDENGYCIPTPPDVDMKWTRGGFESEFGMKYADILSFSKQIAVGMEYLEKNKVVHRDLACRNILLTEDSLNCKIGDFGLSRDIYVDNSYHQDCNGKLPLKWMALESMNSARFTSKSDVWSYGILLWELMTLGATPYPGIPNRHVYHFLLYGGRPEKPKHCSRNMYALMRKCWSDQAPSRPYFSEITSAIDDTLSNE